MKISDHSSHFCWKKDIISHSRFHGKVAAQTWDDSVCQFNVRLAVDMQQRCNGPSNCDLLLYIPIRLCLKIGYNYPRICLNVWQCLLENWWWINQWFQGYNLFRQTIQGPLCNPFFPMVSTPPSSHRCHSTAGIGIALRQWVAKKVGASCGR